MRPPSEIPKPLTTQFRYKKLTQVLSAISDSTLTSIKHMADNPYRTTGVLNTNFYFAAQASDAVRLRN
jgi:hypothetical protein